MAIAVTPTYLYGWRDQNGAYLRAAKLTVTGLSAGSTNNVPHGLTDNRGNPTTPIEVGIEPTSNQTLWENSAADSTNIYVGAGGGAGTSCQIYVVY